MVAATRIRWMRGQRKRQKREASLKYSEIDAPLHSQFLFYTLTLPTAHFRSRSLETGRKEEIFSLFHGGNEIKDISRKKEEETPIPISCPEPYWDCTAGLVTRHGHTWPVLPHTGFTFPHVPSSHPPYNFDWRDVGTR